MKKDMNECAKILEDSGFRVMYHLYPSSLYHSISITGLKEGYCWPWEVSK